MSLVHSRLSSRLPLKQESERRKSRGRIRMNFYDSQMWTDFKFQLHFEHFIRKNDVLPYSNLSKEKFWMFSRQNCSQQNSWIRKIKLLRWKKKKIFFHLLECQSEANISFWKKRFDFNLNCFWRSYSKCVRSLTQSRSRLSALLHFRHQWRSFRFKWFHRPFPFHFGVIFLLFYSSCRCLSLWRFLSNEIRGNSFFFCTFFSQPTDRAFNYKRIQCNINSLWCDFIGQCRVLFARHELVSI